MAGKKSKNAITLEQVVESVSRLRSVYKAADELGVIPGTVYRRLRENGMNPEMVLQGLKSRPDPENGVMPLSTPTKEELGIVYALASVYERFLALPVEHQMDQDEFCRGIHMLQEKVLARSGRRYVASVAEDRGHTKRSAQLLGINPEAAPIRPKRAYNRKPKQLQLIDA